MVYINSRGEIVEKRPLWANFVDFIYAFVEGVQMFFRSLFGFIPNQNPTRASPSGSGPRRPGGPGNPRRKIAGLAADGGPGAPPCMPGGG